MQRADSTRRTTGGFTLLELMIVMTLLGVLGGFGLGFLQDRGSDVELALSMVRDHVRVAALTARTRRLPTSVELTKGDGIEAPTVRARVLVPVGIWSLEERQRGDSRLTATIGGTIVPGRFGMARRPTDREPLLTLPTAESRDTLFDLSEGFAIQLDVKLDTREEMVLARLGTNVSLTLDRDLYPEAKVTFRDGDRAGGSVTMTSTIPLRLHQWTTVTLAHDGKDVSILVDERVGASRAMGGALYQSESDTFEISPGDASVLGLVDEVRVLAYEFTQLDTFPVGVELRCREERIEFGRDGRILSPVEFTLVFGDERQEHRIDPGGVVQ